MGKNIRRDDKMNFKRANLDYYLMKFSVSVKVNSCSTVSMSLISGRDLFSVESNDLDIGGYSDRTSVFTADAEADVEAEANAEAVKEGDDLPEDADAETDADADAEVKREMTMFSRFSNFLISFMAMKWISRKRETDRESCGRIAATRLQTVCSSTAFPGKTEEIVPSNMERGARPAAQH
jgi:hypothetical protein